MKQVYLSSVAEETIGFFFEKYKGNKINDLSQRALIYRRIREFLASFDISQAYIINGKKYVDIENICSVEFLMRNNATEILITNIYFNEEIIELFF